MRRSSLVIATLSLAPSLLAQRFPEAEPNDTVLQAQSVTVGTQIDGSLVIGNVDWFTFTVTSNTRVRIHTSSVPSTIPAHGDTRIALLDATGTTFLAIDDDARGATNGWTSDLTLNLLAGVYTVLVVPFDGATQGPYSLDIAEITPVVYTGTELEPNDTSLTATPTTLAPGGTSYLGTLAPPTPQLADVVPPTTTVASDTVVSSTTTVITATTPMTPSAFVPGFAVQMTSGPNIGLIRAITANTATTITTSAWPVANVAGNTFDIITNNTTTVTRATTPLIPAAWTPPTSGFGRYYLRFVTGANAGLSRQITSNTATTITHSSFPVAATPTDAFVVELVDVDYYQVVLTAPTEGLWFQINEAEAPSVFGHRYEVYNAAGTLLTPTSSTTVPAFGTNAANSSTLAARTSQIRVWPAGTYYIAVRSPTAPFTAAATMPGGVIPSGTYMLELFNMPMDTGGTVPEAAEPNNTTATATPIAPGQIGQGNITNTTGADSSDWWGPIVISSPSTITYQTRQGVAPALGDSTLILRDANGASLLTSTTGNLLAPTTSTSGHHARATVTFFLTPITVYIEVVSPGTTAAQAGNYELQISAVIPAPYVTASYNPVAANGTCGTAPFPTLTNQYTSGTTLGVSETPLLGTTFSRDLRNAPPSAIYVHMIGFSNTLSGSTPLPFDLGVIGAPGCTINVDPVILTVGVTDGVGTAIVNTTLPGNVAFRGFVWYEQAIVENAGANAFGAQVSNYAIAITGERSY